MTTLDARLRIILFVAGLLFGGMAASYVSFDAVQAAQEGETLDAAVRRNVAAILFATHGATVRDPQTDILWFDAPGGNPGLMQTFEPYTFLILAQPAGEKHRDLYRMDARVTPYGVVFDPAWTVNLTNTAQADDGHLTQHGTKVATTVTYQDRLVAVEVRDLAGEDPERAGIADWSRIRLMGNAITNLEQTGDSAGMDQDFFMVDGEAKGDTRLVFSGDVLQVVDGPANVALASIDLTARTATGPLSLTHLPPQRKMKYDFLNWLADRGRGLADKGLAPEWAGSGIELMKEVYFKAKEVQADIEEVAASDVPVEVEEQEVVAEAVEKARFQAEQASLPWPPPPLKPLLDERMKGEGLWQPVTREVVTWQPHAPAPFYRTFIRAEADYTRKKIHIVAWDPAQVRLLMRAGTHNPEPQTGHRGDGRIPREPEHLKRVVGGFNGGFQTAHIWYGMMVDKKVLLRPREYGATVGSWADGRTAFGTWKPHAPIPDDMTHYRQNLPPLIEDKVFNPYRRRTWGWHRKVAGAVGGRTIRSAVCYTDRDYVMYFYSEFSDEHGLTNALLHVGCVYAVHLDMNKGHTGFEFYRLLADAEEPPNEESFRDVEGVRLVGTSMHPTIAHMKAPTRYLGVDYRDYFYLQLRPVVPGDDLAPLQPGGPPNDGQWRVEGIPKNAEFPHRSAWTRLQVANQGRIDIMQLDLRATQLRDLSAEGEADPEWEPLMATLPIWSEPAGSGDVIDAGGFEFRGGTPTTAPAEPLKQGVAIGLDPNGFLWLAWTHNATIAQAAAALKQGGVGRIVWRAPAAGTEESEAPVRLYQPTTSESGAPALIELPLGQLEGKVASVVTRDVRRVVVNAIKRGSSIVRVFPEMRPSQRK